MRKITKQEMKPSYGKWTVIDGPFDGKFLCRCECGKEKTVSGSHLREGRSTACRTCGNSKPCTDIGKKFLHVPRAVYKKIRRAVVDANSRCKHQWHKNYHNYGGRGIMVLFADDAGFISHLLTLPGHDDPSLVLDRKNNEGHYEAGNLRFATCLESGRNKRQYFPRVMAENQVIEAIALRNKNSRLWTFRRLSERYGVSPGTVCLAVNGKTWKHLSGKEVTYELPN